MWKDIVEKIVSVKHYIDQKPDSRPEFQCLCWVWLKAREYKDEEIDGVIKKGLIEPPISEWASSVVFALQKDENSHFSVFCRKLNEKAVWDAYQLRQVTKYVELLRDETILITNPLQR